VNVTVLCAIREPLVAVAEEARPIDPEAETKYRLFAPVELAIPIDEIAATWMSRTWRAAPIRAMVELPLATASRRSAATEAKSMLLEPATRQVRRDPSSATDSKSIDEDAKTRIGPTFNSPATDARSIPDEAVRCQMRSECSEATDASLNVLDPLTRMFVSWAVACSVKIRVELASTYFWPAWMTAAWDRKLKLDDAARRKTPIVWTPDARLMVVCADRK
jgi:hypothetical protein